MKTPSVLLAPTIAVALTSCVVELPSPGPAPTGSTAGATADADIPSLNTLPNGDIQVIFPGQGRDVLFDRSGTLKAGGPGCDDVDLFRAKEAVRSHLAEQSSSFNDV
jgi:hypothetical protein